MRRKYFTVLYTVRGSVIEHVAKAYAETPAEAARLCATGDVVTLRVFEGEGTPFRVTIGVEEE